MDKILIIPIDNFSIFNLVLHTKNDEISFETKISNCGIQARSKDSSNDQRSSAGSTERFYEPESEAI